MKHMLTVSEQQQIVSHLHFTLNAAPAKMRPVIQACIERLKRTITTQDLHFAICQACEITALAFFSDPKPCDHPSTGGQHVFAPLFIMNPNENPDPNDQAPPAEENPDPPVLSGACGAGKCESCEDPAGNCCECPCHLDLTPIAEERPSRPEKRKPRYR